MEEPKTLRQTDETSMGLMILAVALPNCVALLIPYISTDINYHTLVLDYGKSNTTVWLGPLITSSCKAQETAVPATLESLWRSLDENEMLLWFLVIAVAFYVAYQIFCEPRMPITVMYRGFVTSPHCCLPQARASSALGTCTCGWRRGRSGTGTEASHLSDGGQ